MLFKNAFCVFFIFSLLAGTLNTAHALNNPVYEEDTQQDIEQPTIKNFHTSWWDYIEAKPEETTARLAELLNSYPTPKDEDSNALIKQIQARIEAWNTVKKTPTKTVKNNMTETQQNNTQVFDSAFDKQLTQIENQKYLNHTLQNQTIDLNELKQNLKDINKEYNRLTAIHLRKNEFDKTKNSDALLIIDEKIKGNILKEKIKQEEAYLENIENIIKANKKNKKTDPSQQVDYEAIKPKAQAILNKNKKTLEAKQKKLNAIQLKNAHDVPNKGRGYAYEQLINSEVLLAELDVERAYLRLDYLKIKDQKIFKALKNNKPQLQLVYNRSVKRGEHITDIKKQAIKLSDDIRYVLTDKIESDDVTIDVKALKYARQSLNNYDTASLISDNLAQINDQLIDQSARNFLYKGSIQPKLKKHWNTITGALGFSLFKIGDTPVTALGLLRLVVIILFFYKLAKYIRKGFERISTKDTHPASGIYAAGRLLQYVIVVAGILIALSSIGVDFTKLAIFAGALSVGIGFGLQSIVNNFVSGLILLFERTLRVGDVIEMDSGIMGKVKEINVRSTLVTTADNVDLIVPNAELMNNKLINWTLKEKHSRVHIPFGVAYGTDKELVKEAALAATEKVPFTVKHRTPHVWLVNFGDNSLDFELVVWVDFSRVLVSGSIKPTFLWEIETELSKRGIEIPFPQRDLHLRSVDKSIQLTPPSVRDGGETNA